MPPTADKIKSFDNDDQTAKYLLELVIIIKTLIPLTARGLGHYINSTAFTPFSSYRTT